MESKLIDYRKVLFEEKAKLDSILSCYVDKSDIVKNIAEKIENIYANNFESRKPKIMVYGIYNAGKSSIINELLHEDKAVVSDVPTTDAVTKYEWKGYELSDTPGVAAPIEHERVTMEALKENDVVLFVMSTSGSFEKAENYGRIKDIVNVGKKVIVVLNDKEGYLFSDEAGEKAKLEDIKTQVYNNMKKVGIESTDNFSLVVVDAALAKNGRLENNNEDIEQSRFLELERAILSELKNTSSYRLLRNDVQQVIENISDLTKEISKLEDGGEVVQKLNEILKTINDYKTNLRSIMQNYIESQKIILVKELPALIWQNKEDQERINTIVGEKIDKIVEHVSRKLAQEFDELKNLLNSDLKVLIDELEKINVKFKPEVVCPRASIDGASVSEFNLDMKKVQALIENLKDLWDIINKNKTFIDPKTIANLVEKTLLTNMLGKGAVTALSTNAALDLIMKNSVGKMIASGLGKIGIGAVVPYVGPIITILMTLYSLFKDDEQERIERENERRIKIAEAESKAKLELQQNCSFLADDFAEELSLSVGEIIIKTCNDLQNKLEEHVETMENRKNNIAKDIKELRIIMGEYQGLALQLGCEN